MAKYDEQFQRALAATGTKKGGRKRLSMKSGYKELKLPGEHGYVVATDSFMSGWGKAPGRSIVAVEVHNHAHEKHVTDVLERRPEMKRVRFSVNLPRVRRGDHLDVWTRKTHPQVFPKREIVGGQWVNV